MLVRGVMGGKSSRRRTGTDETTDRGTICLLLCSLGELPSKPMASKSPMGDDSCLMTKMHAQGRC